MATNYKTSRQALAVEPCPLIQKERELLRGLYQAMLDRIRSEFSIPRVLERARIHNRLKELDKIG